jgi:hypothetical protein
MVELVLLILFSVLFFIIPPQELFIHARRLSMDKIAPATATYSGHIPLLLGLVCLLEIPPALDSTELRFLPAPTPCRRSAD